MKLEELEMQKFQTGTREKKFYFVYCRKSSEAEDRQVESINDQLKVANHIKIEKGLNVVKTPFTESRSAKMPGRPEFDRMIEEIDKRNDIKGIICWKLNRLFRNPEDEGKIRQRLSDGRIDEIITPSKTYLEADSDFTMAVEGAQAQRFIRDLKEDTARGVNSKLSKGMAPILAPPGYRNCLEKRQGERDIEPALQFTLVRKLFDLFLTGNYSVQGLWYEAEKLGVKSNRGKIVSRTQLYEMLRNPFYTGTRYIYAGKLYTNGVHKRMLLDEEFDLVQDILSKGSHPRGSINTDLLTGIMKCGECGRSITSEVKTKHYKNGNSQTFVYYRCTKKWRGKKCKQPYIRAELLEEQVLEYLDGLQLSPRFVEWAIKWLKVMHGKQEELREAKYKTIEQAHQEVVKRIVRLVDLTLSGMLSAEEGMAKKQELELEKKRMSEELEKIDIHVSEWSSLAIQTFDLVKNIKERFANGTIEQRKTILRVIGSNLILKDKKIYIEIRNPFGYIQKVVSQLNDDKRLEPIDFPRITRKTTFLGSPNVLVGG
jgi:DNA invertase Pin-like site-specific DNA recombinase